MSTEHPGTALQASGPTAVQVLGPGSLGIRSTFLRSVLTIWVGPPIDRTNCFKIPINAQSESRCSRSSGVCRYAEECHEDSRRPGCQNDQRWPPDVGNPDARHAKAIRVKGLSHTVLERVKDC
jgi:hypothetical protein